MKSLCIAQILSLALRDIATNVSAIVRKLLSAVKTYLIHLARKREGTTEVEVPATKEEVKGPFLDFLSRWSTSNWLSSHAGEALP